MPCPCAGKTPGRAESVFWKQNRKQNGEVNDPGHKERASALFCGRAVPAVPWKKSGTPSRVPRCTGAAPQRKAAFAENLFPGFLFAVFPEGAQGALRIRSMTSGILKKAGGRNSEFLPARPSFPRIRKGTWGRCRYRPGRARHQLRGKFCRNFSAEEGGTCRPAVSRVPPRRSLASSGLAEIRVPLWGKAISRRKRGRAFFHALWAFLRQGSRV